MAPIVLRSGLGLLVVDRNVDRVALAVEVFVFRVLLLIR